MRRAAGALAVAVLLGLPLPARASCGPAELVVSGVAARATPGPYGEPSTVVDVVAGARVQVSGGGFPDYCGDTGDTSGCGGPDGPEPLQDVELLLVQGDRREVLATADADASYTSRWDAVLPADLQPGPAALVAGGVGLDLVIAPRR